MSAGSAHSQELERLSYDHVELQWPAVWLDLFCIVLRLGASAPQEQLSASQRCGYRPFEETSMAT